MMESNRDKKQSMGCGDGGNCTVGPVAWEKVSGLGAMSVSGVTVFHARELVCGAVLPWL